MRWGLAPRLVTAGFLLTVGCSDADTGGAKLDASAGASGSNQPAGGAGGAAGAAGNALDASAPGRDASTPSTRDASAGADAATPDGDAAAADAGSVATGGGHYFPAGSPWTRDVSSAPVDPSSATIIAWLDGQGFGLGRLQIDFSIEVLEANAATPRRDFTPTDAFYTPDCDQLPMPVPADGNLEGEDGYQCTNDGDCHLIVHAQDENKLYEMWRADIDGNDFNGGCLAVWDLSRVYPEEGRGEQCSSADAAGFPIAPLLFDADEVAAGEIAHAIRFILPNPRMRAGVYVRPATHAGGPSGPAEAPPYGVRLRLRADYPLASLPNDAARTVARALQRYGMLLADGGNVALTGRSDRRTTAKWDGLLAAQDLSAITPADFEVIEMGDTIDLTYDCVRTPL